MIEFVNNCLIIDEERYVNLRKESFMHLLYALDIFGVFVKRKELPNGIGIQIVKCRYNFNLHDKILSVDDFKKELNAYIIDD